MVNTVNGGRLPSVALAIGLLSLASRAAAQYEPPPPPGPEFGDRSIIVVSDDAAFGIGARFYGRSARGADFSFVLAPAVDYFVARNFSVGAVGRASFDEDGEATVYSLSPLLRVGTVFRLGSRFSFWPRAGLGYALFIVDGFSGAIDEHVLFTRISAPLLVHPVEHFFIGAGPFFYGELIRENNSAEPGTLALNYFGGAALTLGGWW